MRVHAVGPGGQLDLPFYCPARPGVLDLDLVAAPVVNPLRSNGCGERDGRAVLPVTPYPPAGRKGRLDRCRQREHATLQQAGVDRAGKPQIVSARPRWAGQSPRDVKGQFLHLGGEAVESSADESQCAVELREREVVAVQRRSVGVPSRSV